MCVVPHYMFPFRRLGMIVLTAPATALKATIAVLSGNCPIRGRHGRLASDNGPKKLVSTISASRARHPGTELMTKRRHSHGMSDHGNANAVTAARAHRLQMRPCSFAPTHLPSL